MNLVVLNIPKQCNDIESNPPKGTTLQQMCTFISILHVHCKFTQYDNPLSHLLILLLHKINFINHNYNVKKVFFKMHTLVVTTSINTNGGYRDSMYETAFAQRHF